MFLMVCKSWGRLTLKKGEAPLPTIRDSKGRFILLLACVEVFHLAGDLTGTHDALVDFG